MAAWIYVSHRQVIMYIVEKLRILYDCFMRECVKRMKRKYFVIMFLFYIVYNMRKDICLNFLYITEIEIFKKIFHGLAFHPNKLP